MSTENIETFDVVQAFHKEKEAIAQKVSFAYEHAIPLKSYRRLLKKMTDGRIRNRKSIAMNGVVTFDSPHKYWVGFKALGNLIPNQEDRMRWTFNHELEHYNEAREQGMRDILLGFIIGITGDDGSWVGFCSYIYPNGLTKEQIKDIDYHITTAPTELSKWDIKSSTRNHSTST